MKVARENGEGSSTDSIDDQVPVSHLTLPDKVVQLKSKGINLLDKEDYTAVIILYNEAINIHKCSELLSNRTEAYIKRQWNGDFYAALKDCVYQYKQYVVKTLAFSFHSDSKRNFVDDILGAGGGPALLSIVPYCYENMK
ncbi:hypothetical protein QTP88_027255 [Uroleucon formosanum]